MIADGTLITYCPSERSMPSAVSNFLFTEVCSVDVHSELSAAANLLTASLVKQAVQRQVSPQFQVIVFALC